MKLIIVESPTKAKTLSRFLNDQYSLLSSKGHIRNLPKSKLGIDIEKQFAPQYIVPSKAKKVVSDLREEAKKADEIIFASDEDREGEAIAWHLAEVLNLNPSQYKRIAFHEITPAAIKEALKNPRAININLVNAQQARRVLDRLVGYKLSPFLWKKVMGKLSAGRVQSVAVHLIVKREEEIQKFKPQEFWSVTALLQKEKSKEIIEANLLKKGGKALSKFAVPNQKEADKIVDYLQKQNYEVTVSQTKETKKYPLPPFTTSTLQQTAGRRLYFSAKYTMSLAQKLYETGLISYHRTDSVALSEQALDQCQKYISEKFGKKYWPGKPTFYKTKSKRAQQAHEAIRPTNAQKTPEELRAKLKGPSFRLYQLIWQRAVASQAAAAVFNNSRVDIKAGIYTLRATGQNIKFDGFLKIYPITSQEKHLPELKSGDQLQSKELSPEQHFTQPPGRYSEPSLVKELEKLGVGRPSTYAPVISTIQLRNYVQKKENRRFYPTKIGTIVDHLLSEHFPKIVSPTFTAEMEENLDQIAQGKRKWSSVIQDFYQDFANTLEKKYEEVQKKDLTKKTDRKCPKCGAPLIQRMGRFGEFYACSSFPKCKYTEPLATKKTGVKCPKCQQGELIEKRTKKGKIFFACNCYPKCDFALWDKPTGEKCPKCSSLLVEAGKNKTKCSNKDCQFKKSVEK